MATRYWRGKAKDVQQVITETVTGTWAQNETITLTIDGIDFVVTIGTLVTTAQVATTLTQAFNGSTLTDTAASCSPTIAQGGAQAIPQFAELVATNTTASVCTLTVRTAGKPVTLTESESSASGGITRADPTAATGKNWFSNADNWSADTVPVDNDTIIFDSGNVDCKYGLTPAIQPLIVIVTKGFTGRIGLPKINADTSTTPYSEYRTTSLTFDDNTVTCVYHLASGTGSGSALLRFDAGAGQAQFNVYGSSIRATTGVPNCLLLGTHASNTLNVQQGDVGVGFYGEASTLATCRVGNGTTGGADVILGNALTTTSLASDVCGGTLTLETASASGTHNITRGGTLNVLGSAAHGTITVEDGTCNYNSSGTLTTLAVGSAGRFDRSGDSRSATITNLVNLYKGSVLHDPNGVLTLSAGFKVNGGTIRDVTVDNGINRTYTVA